jgi:hypothetical protein
MIAYIVDNESIVLDSMTIPEEDIIIKKLLLFDITGISYYIQLDNNNYKI